MNDTIIFHGSPCQDFSLAGKQAGGDLGSGTRSSLLYETIRIVSKLKPKYVIWENVKNVISQKHRHNFDNYLTEMGNMGYTNYYQVLNAKDYGIPQNRERVFTISILGEHNLFNFSPKQELKLKLKDILEDEVDEKYYLKNINNFVKNKYEEKGYVPEFFNPYNKIDLKDTAQTQTSQCGSTTSSATILYSDYSKKKIEENIKRINDNESGTITANAMQSFNHDNCQMVNKNYRIRKLTPKECFRLMGFDDEDFYRANKVNSNSQLYKQAGNSIVVNVLESIFNNLLDKEKEYGLIELFGGIGAPRKALTRQGFKIKSIDYVEIDKYAVNSYNAIFNEKYEPQDILKYCLEENK